VTGTFVLILAAGALALGAVRTGAEIPSGMEEKLRDAKEIQVSTRRKSGEWSEPAWVWFHFDGKAVYFTTSPTSHKARRIAAGSPVRVSIDGQSFEGAARLTKDREVVERLSAAYSEKYWIAWVGLFRPRWSRVESGKTVIVEVMPSPAR
jgi:pyridoxine/pyridoxamine 5'-phosphate oxidase